MAERSLTEVIAAAWEKADADPFAPLYDATMRHLRQHRCHCFPYDKGPFLIALMTVLRPRRVLEIGTALGYSALCLAAGAAAHIDTVEADQLHATIARRNIAEAGYTDRITVHQGGFDRVGPSLQPGYDFAFFDGRNLDPAACAQIERLMAEDGALLSANLNFGRGPGDLSIFNSSRWETQFVDPAEESALSLRVRRF